MCLCFPTTGFKLQFSAWFYHNISIPFHKLVEFYLGSRYTVPMGWCFHGGLALDGLHRLSSISYLLSCWAW